MCLNKLACRKRGSRLYIYATVTRIIFCTIGAIKLGAIVGPLFEAFMEGAVHDRLADSEAKVIVTTPELLSRVPVDRLTIIKTYFCCRG